MFPLVAANAPPKEFPAVPTATPLGNAKEAVASRVPPLMIDMFVLVTFPALLKESVDPLTVVFPENVLEPLLRVKVLPAALTTKLPKPVIAPDSV